MSTRRTPRYELVEIIDDEDDVYIPESMRNALELADEGLTFEEIAKVLDTDAERVRMWCEDAWAEQARETLLN